MSRTSVLAGGDEGAPAVTLATVHAARVAVAAAHHLVPHLGRLLQLAHHLHQGNIRDCIVSHVGHQIF